MESLPVRCLSTVIVVVLHTPSKEQFRGGSKELLSILFFGIINDFLPSSTTTNNNDGKDDAAMQFPSIQYEPDLEPSHIIPTVHPDEHPLHVRDEMIQSLARLSEEQIRVL